MLDRCVRFSLSTGTDSRPHEEVRMTRVIHTPKGHLARIFFLALPVAVMACGGAETDAIREAEAAGVTPVTVSPVTSNTPSTPVEVRTLGGDMPRPTSFETAEKAYESGEYRVAKEMYEAKVGTTPTDAHGHYMLGLSSWKSGDFAGAKAAFDKSIELNPQFSKAYFNQGRVLLDLGRVPEALEAIGKGRAIDSTSPEGLRLVARAQAEGGDVDGALATYRELLQRDEADAWGLNNLGMLLLGRGDVSGALGPLARAVQVKPTAPLFLNNLGMALERSGHTLAALRRYELAVQHDSSFTKAVRNVERVKVLVTDTTVGDEVDVARLAEEYRQVVKSWKVEVPTP
jgi:tetratricopeptide (TPR) repeat protein